MEADGALRFVGRRDDMMNAQGYRVAPQEVEEAILTHGGVADVGVTELPVEEGLSIIAAWIVPAEGAEPDPKSLREHAAGLLAAYKVPKEWRFADKLPRTGNGKLRRSALASLP